MREPQPTRYAARALARALTLTFGAAAVACSDAPSAPSARIPLTICAWDWAAFRNEGAPWIRTEGQGRYSFMATERVAIADARMTNGAPMLRVQLLAASQAERLYPCPSTSTAPITPLVRGVANGLGDGQYAFVGFGPVTTSAFWSDPTFQLPSLVHADLVAVQSHMEAGLERMILRRGVVFSPSDTVAIDFSSAEAFTPQPATIRWVGSQAHLQVQLRTATGTHVLVQSQPVGSGRGDAPQVGTLRGVPTIRTAAGDMHQAFLSMTRDGTDHRLVRFAYRYPRDIDVAMGAPAVPPTFIRTATTPELRVRARVPSQEQYDGAVSLLLSQERLEGPNVVYRISVQLLATREYFGRTPTAWVIELPDLRALPGFDAFPGLQGSDFAWSLTRYDANALKGDSVETEGMVARLASTSGVVSLR